MTYKKEYQRELDKLKRILLKVGYIRKFQFHTISIQFFYDIFIENGFKEYEHQFKRFDKPNIRKSYSLRKTLKFTYKIHILLRQTKTFKWIAIHRDTEKHVIIPLNRTSRLHIIELINNAIIHKENEKSLVIEN